MSSIELPLIAGLFADRDSAERAYTLLVSRGYTRDEIDLVISERGRAQHFPRATRDETDLTDLGTKAAEGAGYGGAIGGTLGALAAAVAAVGTSIALPGLGLVIAGPLAAAIAGAGAGAAVGGIVGALIGWGIPEERVQLYEQSIREGHILLAVRPKTQEDEAFLRNALAVTEPIGSRVGTSEAKVQPTSDKGSQAPSSRTSLASASREHATHQPSTTYRQVDTFFATDRAQAPSWKVVDDRFQGRRGSLQLGIAQVSVPFKHVTGNVERPRFWRLEFSQDPEKHFTLMDLELLPTDDFVERLNGMFEGEEQPRRAFVFVHGYNVTFRDAALRTAQIAVDIGLRTVPIFYSWPSQGSPQPYIVDESNAEWSRSNLLAFLELLAARSDAEEIVVIAHSMGTRPTAWAMEALLAKRPDLQSRFRELVLAAPDIDAEVFIRDIVPALTSIHERITLYASSKDRALIASKVVHGSPRAGDSGDEIVVVPGVDTVDASVIDTDFLGHSYLVSERPLLMDLTMLLQNNIRAANRKHLDERSKGDNRYWAFRR